VIRYVYIYNMYIYIYISHECFCLNPMKNEQHRNKQHLIASRLRPTWIKHAPLALQQRMAICHLARTLEAPGEP
jgi:hypothetical protein